jgi:hypothetical protein
MYETKIIFHSDEPDDTDADFTFCGCVYRSNGLSVSRIEELLAFFNEMNRVRSWGLIEHIENIQNECMYTLEDRTFLLFLVSGCAFNTISKDFNKK